MEIEMWECKTNEWKYLRVGSFQELKKEEEDDELHSMQEISSHKRTWTAQEKIHKHLVPLAIEAFYFYTLHHSF